MSLNQGKILGIRITVDPKAKVLEYIQKYLDDTSKVKSQKSKVRQNRLVIVTPNSEQIVYARSNPWFAKILNRADVALPDGIGIVAAARFLSAKSKEQRGEGNITRIPGVEFMENLVKLAADRGHRIGLIGGRGGLAVRAFERLYQKYPRLEGWAEDPGELNIGHLGNLGDLGDLKRIAEKIRSTDTRMVFVGLGAPKQEYFIEKLVNSLQKTDNSQTKKGHHPLILMSVGGSFDILTGRLKRAPLVIRSIGFEWAWRLVAEPWRFRRQLALLKFIYLVLREKVRTG